MTNNRRRNNKGGSMGILGWTFIVFLVLKLTNIIDWSWWWVTAPLWGIFALVISVAILGFTGVVGGSVIQEYLNKRRRAAREKKRLDLRK